MQKKRLRQKTSRRAINGLKDKFHISKFTQIPFKIYTLENVYGGTTITKPSRLLTASVFRRSSKKGFDLAIVCFRTFKNRRKCPRVEILNEIPSFKHYPLPPPLLPPPTPQPRDEANFISCGYGGIPKCRRLIGCLSDICVGNPR